jgi:hypothetical protein
MRIRLLTFTPTFTPTFTLTFALTFTLAFAAAFVWMVAPASAWECNDGIDNDGDTLIDMADPGCVSPRDRSEDCGWGCPLCHDGVDNDGDGLVDTNDPGCLGDPFKDSETDLSLVCDNGLDDDGDELADYPADPHCTDLLDDTEHCGGEPGCPECDDNVNNEMGWGGFEMEHLYDDLIDTDDPQCWGPLDTSEYNDCWDGRDNDGDGLIDDCKTWNQATCDPGCGGEAKMFKEDGIGDGEIPHDNCGIGFELAFLLPGLMWLRRRVKCNA